VIVVPVDLPREFDAAKNILWKQSNNLCTSAISDNRKNKVVLVVRSTDEALVKSLNADLLQIKRRCKLRQFSEVVIIRLNKPTTNDQRSIQIAAMDEVVDRYSGQKLYLIMTPYTEYQLEFLNRIRINAISNFQVFFPIPFVEFHPYVANFLSKPETTFASSNISESELSNRFKHAGIRLNSIAYNVSSPLSIHRDRGFFDKDDFSVAAMYGVDYLSIRSRIREKMMEMGGEEELLDLAEFFLSHHATVVNILRTIEPTLYIRYHKTICPTNLRPPDLVRCDERRRQRLGTRAQLANLIFGNNKV